MSQFYKSKTRECRARRAYEHTLDMDRRFKDEIVYSVKNSKVYNYATNVGINFEYKTDILVVPHDTVTALEQYRDGRTAILNFASYKHPGGKFLDGSMAQEESLCHASFLYNVLREFKDTYYAWNNKNLNHSLYLNRALFSPDICFEGTQVLKSSVITCAAPNKKAAMHSWVSEQGNTLALKERIKLIFSVAKVEKINTLILGAFGCGVFGQDPREVAKIFKDYLVAHDGIFASVVFAIPESNNGNYEIFKSVIGSKKC